MQEFDEESEEFEYSESDAQDVLDEIDESDDDEEQYDAAEVMGQAVQRIEEANLWKLLISHTFFTAGSARSEIIHSVTKKIKQFAVKELEILLGMKSKTIAAPTVQSPFSSEEVAVLKMLIGKVLKKDVSVAATVAQEKKPELVPLEVSKDKAPIKAVSAISAQPQETPRRVRKKKVAKKEVQKKTFATPNNRKLVKPMPSVDQVIRQHQFNTPNMNVSAEKGVNNPHGGNLLGNIVKNLVGNGSSIAVDDRDPSDSP